MAGFPTVRLIKSNIGWLASEKIIKGLLGVIITGLLARHLGPETFGLLTYCLAIITILHPFATLGLTTITPRELICNSEHKDQILGSTFLAQSIGSLIALLSALVLIRLINSDHDESIIIAGILSISLLFKSFDYARYHLEALTLSKIASKVDLFAFTICFISKLILINYGASVYHFATVILLETVISSLAIAHIHNKEYFRIKLILPSKFWIKHLLHESWPMIFSSGLVLAIINSDKILLKALTGAQSAGIYGAASKLVESTFFLTMIISASVAPKLTLLHKNNDNTFFSESRKITINLFLIGLFIAISAFLGSTIIIHTLYGSDFDESVVILQINAFTIPLVYLISFRTRCLSILKCTVTTFKISALTFACNIFLNFLLIPQLGPAGASIASLFSWFLSLTFFAFIFKDSRSLTLKLTKRSFP